MVFRGESKRLDVIWKLSHLLFQEGNSGCAFPVKGAAVSPPDLVALVHIGLAVGQISAAHAAFPEASGQLLCSQAAPSEINVSFVSNFVYNHRLAVLVSPVCNHFCGLVNIYTLNAYMCDPGSVVVKKRNAVVDGTKVSVRVIFHYNSCVSIPVFYGFLRHQIVFICHGPPDIFEVGKTSCSIG